MAQLFQVIESDGAFCSEKVEKFVHDIDLAHSKDSYQVVAIMGPQSSGKSTLLNHMFGTDFIVMDAQNGRSQTTKGIWLSKSPKMDQITTLVLDLEGSDGRERGEDDTNFEKQSSLFALAVADVLLVNIWCHDIGREQGSGKPLLKTIFQVNLKLFAPEPNRRRSVLLFVLRDKTRTPVEKMFEILKTDLNKMWESITKPPQYQDHKIQDFFEIRYMSFSNFEERPEEFQSDCDSLRKWFVPGAPDALIPVPDSHFPGSTFTMHVKGIWDTIRSDRDLNLPAHKVMVAQIRCQQILEDQISSLLSDQAWSGLVSDVSAAAAVEFGPALEGFSPRCQSLLDSCLLGYDEEAKYFDSHICHEKRAELVMRLAGAVQPLYDKQLKTLIAETVRHFDLGVRLGLQELKEAAVKVTEAEALLEMETETETLTETETDAVASNDAASSSQNRNVAASKEDRGDVAFPSDSSGKARDQIDLTTADITAATDEATKSTTTSTATTTSSSVISTVDSSKSPSSSSSSSSSAAPTTFIEVVSQQRSAATRRFTDFYDRHLAIEGAWSSAAALDEFNRRLSACEDEIRRQRIHTLWAAAAAALGTALASPVQFQIEKCRPCLWKRLHVIRSDCLHQSAKRLKRDLGGLGLAAAEVEELVGSKLAAAATRQLRTLVKEAAMTRLSLMRDRFYEAFAQDDEAKIPRIWNPTLDIPKIAAAARMAAAAMLAQLAVFHEDAEGEGAEVRVGGGGGDKQDRERVNPYEAVEESIIRMASASFSSPPPLSSSSVASSTQPAPPAATTLVLDALSASSWPDIEDKNVLLRPHEVRVTWREFLSASNLLIQQALSAQQANRLASQRPPPFWAMAAMVVLGWNEAKALLLNPLLLILVVALVLFLKSLYVELDVDTELSKGLIPGALRLSQKLVPASQKVAGSALATVLDMATRSETKGKEEGRKEEKNGEARKLRWAPGGSVDKSEKKDQ